MTFLEPDARIFDGVAGEMQELLGARDWSSTPLGATSSWSPILRVMVSTMLRSGFPTVINWGPEMVAMYNDAYIPLLGRKHPQAAGRSAKDTWPEAWEWVAPRLEQVLYGERTVRFGNERQILARNGYPEECYFTFSQSPIVDVDGSVGGILTVATETTATVLAERRMRIGGELAGLSTGGWAPAALTPDEEGTGSFAAICGAALRILSTARESVPFAVAFVGARDGATDPTVRPVAHHGLVPRDFSGRRSPWVAEWTATAERVIRTGQVEVLTGLRAMAPGVLQPGPLGPLHPDGAVMMPLTVGGRAQPVGAMLFGLTPYRILDADYQAFLSMVVRQLGIVLTDAAAHDDERQQFRALAQAAIGHAEANADDLRRGLDSNRVIGTAIGVIMTNYRLSAEQAFRLLTTASQGTNRKVRDIAATVTETGSLPYRRTEIDDLLIRTSSAACTDR